MKTFLPVLLICLLLLGCEREKIVIREVEKEYNWKQHPAFQYALISQLNSFATEDYLFILGPNNFSRIAAADALDPIDAAMSGSNVFHIANQWEQPQSKPPVGSDFFIDLSNINSQLSLTQTLNPANGAMKFKVSDLDNTFSRFYTVHYADGETAAINNKNQVLIPYHAGGLSDIKLLFIDTKIVLPGQSWSRIDTVKTKIIEPPHDIHFQSIRNIQSIADLFFVAGNDFTYRINSNGEEALVLEDPLFHVVEKDNMMYGFGFRHMYTSADRGLSWTQRYEIPSSISLLTNITKVSEKVVGYRYAQIFEFEPGISSLGIRELDNDGLDGKLITSISAFQDTVYVTSLAGVFYKSLDNFFVNKVEE